METVEEDRQCLVMVLHLKRSERERQRKEKNGRKEGRKEGEYYSSSHETMLVIFFSSKSKKSDSKKHRDHTSSATLSFPTTSIQKLSKLVEVS